MRRLIRLSAGSGLLSGLSAPFQVDPGLEGKRSRDEGPLSSAAFRRATLQLSRQKAPFLCLDVLGGKHHAGNVLLCRILLQDKNVEKRDEDGRDRDREEYGQAAEDDSAGSYRDQDEKRREADSVAENARHDEIILDETNDQHRGRCEHRGRYGLC